MYRSPLYGAVYFIRYTCCLSSRAVPHVMYRKRLHGYATVAPHCGLVRTFHWLIYTDSSFGCGPFETGARHRPLYSRSHHKPLFSPLQTGKSSEDIAVVQQLSWHAFVKLPDLADERVRSQLCSWRLLISEPHIL